MLFFTPEQREELAAHLAIVIPSADIPGAMITLDHACRMCVISTIDVHAERQRARGREHFRAMTHHANALLELLRQQRPFMSTALQEHWAEFDAALTSVRDAAAYHADPPRPDGAVRVGPERPRKAHGKTLARERLIVYIASIYPPDKATTTAGNHFERTVRMILDWTRFHDFDDPNVDPDVHKWILDALRYQPPPAIRFEAAPAKRTR